MSFSHRRNVASFCIFYKDSHDNYSNKLRSVFTRLHDFNAVHDWRYDHINLQLKLLDVTVRPMLKFSSISFLDSGTLVCFISSQSNLIFKNVNAVSIVIFCSYYFFLYCSHCLIVDSLYSLTFSKT